MFGGLVVVHTGGIAWRVCPSLTTYSVFCVLLLGWSLVLLNATLFGIHRSAKYSLLGAPGAALNMVAVIANDGYMPVAARFVEPGDVMPPSHVVMLSSHKLKYLCDVLWGATSIGDWLMLGGIVVGMVVVSVRSSQQQAAS